MTDEPSPGIDVTVPNSARIWNYWLGGKDNYEADRVMGEQVKALFPAIVDIARADRAFIGRVVRFLAAEAGIRQFLDMGTGLPTADNTHQVAQRVAPESRIVYVDNDPLILAHARALLTSAPEGACHYVDADMADTAKVLAGAARWLDLAQPVGLMFMGVLGHFSPGEGRAIVSGVLNGMPSGSYLAVYGTVNTDEALVEATRIYEESGANPYRTLSLEEFAGHFEGLELVPPGIVAVDEWRPEPGMPRWPDAPVRGGVGRKK